jgi:cytochrome c oxidase accessory protein FixG
MNDQLPNSDQNEASNSSTTLYQFSNPSERPDSALLAPEQHVLPTLESDGSRRWVNPSLAQGFFWNRRRAVAYLLIAFFVTLPHLRFGGKPLVLLDIIHRQFTFLGHTFYPTDSPLLALLMLTGFFSIMFVTATAGRVWCGWGCPQTVYIEFLFRPIDRIFLGTSGRGGHSSKTPGVWRKAMRLLVYLVCCMFLAHTFLSYFVGTDQLAKWIWGSPFKHPVAFLVMGVATGAMLFDFLYFREQFCMIACPYGRFQSVMLDRHSWIVSYDHNRGEPRGKAKIEGIGDCVDCNRCVAVCPTGIDIRRGLQLECIHCAQCIDACDAVMQKLGRPIGLVRYSSQEALEGRNSRWLRPRTVIYPTLIAVALSLFAYVLSTKFSFDARLLRSPGAPFTAVSEDGVAAIQNNIRLRLVNRSEKAQTYSIEVKDPPGVIVEWSDGNAPRLEPNGSVLAPARIRFPAQLTVSVGSVASNLIVRDDSGAEHLIPFRLIGPR